MAEIDPRLNEILSDENRLQQVLELAQMLSRSGGAATQPPPAAPPPAAPPLSSADLLAAIAGASGGQAAPTHVPPHAPPTPEAQAGAGNFSAVLEALPGLLQAFSGSANVLPENKVNLVQAIRPYAADHAGSFDRAIRMANIAKAAKSAFNTLGGGSKQT